MTRLHWAMVMLAGMTLLTLLLGVWQVRRGLDRQLAEQHYMAQQGGEIAAWQGLPPLYQPRRLQGRWWPERELLLDARSRDGQLGFEVVTPFVLADGSVVLVNRGWLAQGRAVPAPISVEVERVNWPRFVELASTAPQGNVFQNITAERFARWAGIAPVAYARASGAEEPFMRQTGLPGLPSERHWGYAMTWWLMTLCGVMLCWRFYKAGRRYEQTET
ncbi:SURF1 family protein [Chitinibacteraceae bacterium HSL-7]